MGNILSKTPVSSEAVDWSKWSPPGPNDVRSPCPAINALANHGFIPRSGKGISKEMMVKALTNPETIHLDPRTAAVFTAGAIAANPDHHAHTFNLDHVNKHNFIEHDVSLSRGDSAFGSNSAFNAERWNKVVDVYAEGGATTVSYHSASKARFARLKESMEMHEKAGKDFKYGIKEVITSYGESALFLAVLGRDGVAPLQHVKIFFEEGRLPYKEGWRPPTEVIDQTVMHKNISKLLAANEHRKEEAEIVGMSEVHALENAIESIVKVPTMCTVM